MSFNAVETSDHGGAKYALYKLEVGTASWFYTTSKAEKTYLGDVYVPATCKNSPIKSASDVDKNEVTLSLVHTLPICELLKTRSPAAPLHLTIYEGHEGEAELVKSWVGRSINFAFKPPSCEITTESVLTAMRRMAANLIISSRCSVPLYGRVCGVDRDAHVTTTVVSGRAGLTLAAPGLVATANWYAGGYVEWDDPAFGIVSSQDIESSSGAGIVLSGQPQGLAIGTPIRVYPGCNHVWAEDCLNKFNNTLRCPAFVGMNGRNPFAGYSVF